jgi:hypothetical protein
VENWIWVIVFIAAGLFKLLGKLKAETEDEPAPPPSIPKPKPRQPYRPPPHAAPRPAAHTPVPERWKVDAKRLEDFVDRVSRQPKARASRVPPMAAKPAPAPAAPPSPKPAPTVVPAPVEKPSRAALWGAAMRDKTNLRNVIIATEILGPPRGA